MCDCGCTLLGSISRTSWARRLVVGPYQDRPICSLTRTARRHEKLSQRVGAREQWSGGAGAAWARRIDRSGGADARGARTCGRVGSRRCARGCRAVAEWVAAGLARGHSGFGCFGASRAIYWMEPWRHRAAISVGLFFFPRIKSLVSFLSHWRFVNMAMPFPRTRLD